MKITTLRRKALNGLLEVEDLLRAAVENQPGLPEELARLTVECGWQSNGLLPDGTRVVPLAKWAAVVTSYSRGGFAALRMMASDPENIPFVLGLVEQIKTNESVALVLEMCRLHVTHPAHSEALAFEFASAFNSLLSFKLAAPVTATQAEGIRKFLFNVYPTAHSEAHRAAVLLALRGVGDQSAVRFVELAADFNEPWEQTKSAVLRAIRKKVKGT